MSLSWLGLTELRTLLDEGKLSSLELTQHSLQRIAKADGSLHAFTEVYAEQAQAIARGADLARASGLPLGPLHGLPVVLKDLLDIEGQICTLGSKHFLKRCATQTSATVERLLRAGMVPLGKLHMTEFAFGGWGTNPLMGTPRNPWDLNTHRVPGGSSSGTGVAVAARLYRGVGRCGLRAGWHWQRHGWLGTHPRGLQWAHWFESDLWQNQPAWHGFAELDTRLDRAVSAQCARLRSVAGCLGGA